jgi:hypothetical protein
MTPQYKKYATNFLKVHSALGMQVINGKLIKKSKYNNKKTTVDNIKFDSQGESERYLELKQDLKDRKIQNLERQKSIELQPHFKYKGKMERAINYIADFYYYDNEKGQIVIEEFKGMETDTFKLKRKMLLKNVVIPNNYYYLQTGTKFR